METPKPAADVVKGASKALTLQNIIFVAVIFLIVVFMVKYFTRQEIVTEEVDGTQKTFVKSSIAWNKPKKAA